MTFETPPLMDEWTREHVKAGCKTDGAAGEQFEYTFLPTAIVEISTVRCICCGEKFTLYDGRLLKGAWDNLEDYNER